MKRKFSKLLFLFGIINLCIANTYAFELKYSEWIDTYPENIDEILIESEDRFYWYKDNEYDIEYLKKEDISDKLYDENDFKYYESEKLETKPEEFSERVINEINETITYSSNDVKGIMISLDDGIKISEIDIRDENNERIICDYLNELNDDIKDVYYEMDKELYCHFDKKYDYSNIKTTIYVSGSNEKYLGLSYNLIAEDNEIIYYTNMAFKSLNHYVTFTYKMVFPKLERTKTYYTYKDKLYKTYKLEREYINEYYSNLDGYIKDESTLKTFYRYIINDFIIVDENDSIVLDENYCKKEFCKLIYLTKKEDEEIIENPKTGDNIFDIFILLILSVISFIYFFVKKSHTNN